MKKLLPTAALLLAATLAAPAHAQFAKAEDAIQYRQGAFRVLGHHFGRLGAMANGKMPYNAATAAADGDVIAAVAKLPVTGFVPGSETGLDTRALPALWKELPKVKELSDKMVAETGKLAVAGFQPQLAARVLRERDGRHHAGVRVAEAMSAGTQRRCMVRRRIRPAALCGEGNDRHTLAGAVLAAALAAVGGAERVADAARDGLRHEGLDLEVVLRAGRRGQAGRDVDGSCGVAPTESERHRGLAVGLLQSCISRIPACCRSARSSSAGSVLTRREARRRIPAQAWALKKYLGGIDATSTTCHKKHATAPLGDAEILSIEQAPGDAAPGSRHTTCVRPFLPWRFERTAFAGQCAQEVSEGVAAVAEDAGDVFPDERGRRAAVLVAGLVDGIS